MTNISMHINFFLIGSDVLNRHSQMLSNAVSGLASHFAVTSQSIWRPSDGCRAETSGAESKFIHETSGLLLIWT